MLAARQRKRRRMRSRRPVVVDAADRPARGARGVLSAAQTACRRTPSVTGLPQEEVGTHRLGIPDGFRTRLCGGHVLLLREVRAALSVFPAGNSGAVSGDKAADDGVHARYRPSHAGLGRPRRRAGLGHHRSSQAPAAAVKELPPGWVGRVPWRGQEEAGPGRKAHVARGRGMQQAGRPCDRCPTPVARRGTVGRGGPDERPR